METLTLWNGKAAPRIGIGCWAIGGPMFAGDTPINYAGANDATSLKGLALAYELGARIFDTAAAYGGGHSEELIGQALAAHDDVVIVSKFGYVVDPDTRRVAEPDVTPGYLRRSVDDSRRRLRRDCVDVMLLHINDCEIDDAKRAMDALGELRHEGKIAGFGWSTDYPERLLSVADREGFVAVEADINVFRPAETILDIAKEKNLLAIGRLPLAMGLLTGKYNTDTKLAGDDLRAHFLDWMVYFRDGRASPEFARMLDDVRDLLTVGGRTVTQGALSWILAKSPQTIPVPGFKTEAQIRENLATLEYGPLPDDAMREIEIRLAGVRPAMG